jgi:2-oxoglutarate ferredoxin oxidoreductase subunit alpha
VREALDGLAREGRAVDRMRIRAFPFAAEVAEFAARHELLLVVEQNRDAQMRHLLVAEAGVPGEKLISALDFAGMPLTADFVREAAIDALRRLSPVSAASAAGS